MDAIDTMAAARAVERLVVVIFGGASLILGWSLFKAHIVKDQAAEMVGLKWSIKLQRVGPGIFFALFGTAVLVTALTRPLNLRSEESAATERRTRARPSPGDSTADGALPLKRMEARFGFTGREGADQVADAEDAVRALNTLRRMCLDPQPSGTARNAQALKRASDWIDDQRKLAGRILLGDYAATYEDLAKKALDQPGVLQRLPDEDREKYFDADNRMQLTFAEGKK